MLSPSGYDTNASVALYRDYALYLKSDHEHFGAKRGFVQDRQIVD